MSHYLIVANQTLGGEKLRQVVQERIGQGATRFYIVVPLTAPEHESAAWSLGFTLGGGEMMTYPAREQIEEEERRYEAALDESYRRAEERLAMMVEQIRSMRGDAAGMVADADPVVATKAILADEDFDEVIVSTLPPGLSRWLKMDLPSRIARLTDAPVTMVEAEETSADH